MKIMRKITRKQWGIGVKTKKAMAETRLQK